MFVPKQLNPKENRNPRLSSLKISDINVSYSSPGCLNLSPLRVFQAV